jgi:excisionase family DNA binding protein
MMLPNAPARLLTTVEAAARAGLARRTLTRLIRQGRGPTVVRLTPRTFRFRPEDIDAWLQDRTHPSEVAR